MITTSAGRIDCRGYGISLSPWGCLENQFCFMCLPGWPCETCEEAVGVATKGKEFYCPNHEVEMSTGLCDAARLEAQRRSLSWPEGLGWLEICLECSVEATEIDRPANHERPKSKKRRVPAWLKNASPAVRRSYGII